jgi:hypothetical protein
MASPAQMTANRVNATRSTGPSDTSNTRFNSMSHGLAGKQTVIRGESQQEYDTFAAKLRKDLTPRSAIEGVLADRVIAAAWRLQRFTRVETSFFNDRIDAYLEAHPDSDPDSALSALFTDPAGMARMRLFMRYQAATQREYDKAYKEFKAAQKEQAKKDREQLALGIAATYEEESSESEISFASHNAPRGRSSTITAPWQQAKSRAEIHESV